MYPLNGYEIFNEYRSSCGSRRMVKHLRAEGHEIGRYKVRRIMRQLGLKAKTPKRFKLTTDSKHLFPVAANVLDRKFDVRTPIGSGLLILASAHPGH
jgi:putative transposase